MAELNVVQQPAYQLGLNWTELRIVRDALRFVSAKTLCDETVVDTVLDAIEHGLNAAND